MFVVVEVVSFVILVSVWKKRMLMPVSVWEKRKLVQVLVWEEQGLADDGDLFAL